MFFGGRVASLTAAMACAGLSCDGARRVRTPDILGAMDNRDVFRRVGHGVYQGTPRGNGSTGWVVFCVANS